MIYKSIFLMPNRIYADLNGVRSCLLLVEICMRSAFLCLENQNIQAITIYFSI